MLFSYDRSRKPTLVHQYNQTIVVKVKSELKQSTNTWKIYLSIATKYSYKTQPQHIELSEFFLKKISCWWEWRLCNLSYFIAMRVKNFVGTFRLSLYLWIAHMKPRYCFTVISSSEQIFFPNAAVSMRRANFANGWNGGWREKFTKEPVLAHLLASYLAIGHAGMSDTSSTQVS